MLGRGSTPHTVAEMAILDPRRFLMRVCGGSSLRAEDGRRAGNRILMLLALGAGCGFRPPRHYCHGVEPMLAVAMGRKVDSHRVGVGCGPRCGMGRIDRLVHQVCLGKAVDFVSGSFRQ